MTMPTPETPATETATPQQNENIFGNPRANTHGTGLSTPEAMIGASPIGALMALPRALSEIGSEIKKLGCKMTDCEKPPQVQPANEKLPPKSLNNIIQ